MGIDCNIPVRFMQLETPSPLRSESKLSPVKKVKTFKSLPTSDE